MVAHGEDQDRNCGVGADGAADFNTAEAGHHEVGDNEVGRPVAKKHKTFFRVVGGTHVKALRRKGGAEHAGNLRFVVDDQDSFWHSVLLSWADYIIREGGYDA